MDESIVSIAAGDDIRPYKIHVSSKYLELTKKKLELTRLPHEILLPQSREWEQGTPKSEIEPLIDFWLEEYSWRAREAHLNATLSQYRAAISIPGVPVPLRVHFIHIKSPHAHAVPLLLVPGFPLTNLSLVPLITPLTNPPSSGTVDGEEEREGNIQPFHIVIPSIPGIGFSDAFTFPPSLSSSDANSPSVLESTAHIFNALMLKLSYPQYLCSSTGCSAPAVDYHIPRLLAANHGDNCIGIHLINPPVEEPKLAREPWTWTKFAIARFFHASVFGYVAEDWRALTGSSYRQRHKATRSPSPSRPPLRASDPDLEAAVVSSPPPPEVPPPPQNRHSTSRSRSTTTTSALGLSAFGLLSTPNTLSYALCDSPVGLLSLVLAGLKAVSPDHTLSQMEVIDVAQLAWLPGPEGAMRFWSSAAGEGERMMKKGKRSEIATAVTAFLGDEAAGEKYRPPTWASCHHNVVWTRRREGRAGLLVWEKPDVVVDGVRGLAVEVVKSYPGLRGTAEEVPTIGIELTGVVIEEAVEGEQGEIQMDVESPDTVILAREL